MESQNNQTTEQPSLKVTSQIETITPPIVVKKPNTLMFVIVSAILAASIAGLGVYYWQKTTNGRLLNDLDSKNVSLEKSITEKNNAISAIRDYNSSFDIGYPSAVLKSLSLSSFPVAYSVCSPYMDSISFGSYANGPTQIVLAVASELSVSQFNVQVEKQIASTNGDIVCIDPPGMSLSFDKVRQLFSDGTAISKVDYIPQDYKGDDYHIAPKLVNSRTWYASSVKDSSGVWDTYTTFIDGKMVDLKFLRSDLPSGTTADELMLSFTVNPIK